MTALMLGLVLATWIAPSCGGTVLVLNVFSAMGFIYQRGEPEVVRDDLGQIGEVKPFKAREFGLMATVLSDARSFRMHRR